MIMRSGLNTELETPLEVLEGSEALLLCVLLNWILTALFINGVKNRDVLTQQTSALIPADATNRVPGVLCLTMMSVFYKGAALFPGWTINFY